MTIEQTEVVEECNSEFRGIYDNLERLELNLRQFSFVKADPSDPYSTDLDDVADEIYSCRDKLNDAIELLKAFNEDVSE